jgi:hypothetical protein
MPSPSAPLLPPDSVLNAAFLGDPSAASVDDSFISSRLIDPEFSSSPQSSAPSFAGSDLDRVLDLKRRKTVAVKVLGGHSGDVTCADFDDEILISTG